jgi:hypothetical protein
VRILLAFVHQGPGHGVIRARVYANGARVQKLTVGGYRYRQGSGDWIARLWAVPGEPTDIVPDGFITASDVCRLSNLAAARRKWWT